MSRTVQAIRAVLQEGRALSEDEAFEAFEEVFDGRAAIAQTAALVTALKARGESAAELVGLVRAIRRRAVGLHPRAQVIVDISGAGSDCGAFRISTAAACVVAGAGVRVAKQVYPGGAAEALEALGLRLEAPPATVEQAVDEIGLAFVATPHFCRGMRHVLPVRGDIGVRTIFELAAPLVNPVGATVQVLGVDSPERLELMAEAMRRLGCRRGYVVSGDGGLDEASLSGESSVLWFDSGARETTRFSVDPAVLGFSPAPVRDIFGGMDAEGDAAILRAVLEGASTGARRDIVVLNAALGIAAARPGGLEEAVRQARLSLESGAALRKLEEVKALYRG